MATILEFPKGPANTVRRAMSDDTISASDIKDHFLSHIEEVLTDYRNKNASLAEVSEHIKLIVAELVDTLAESGPSHPTMMRL